MGLFDFMRQGGGDSEEKRKPQLMGALSDMLGGGELGGLLPPSLGSLGLKFLSNKFEKDDEKSPSLMRSPY